MLVTIVRRPGLGVLLALAALAPGLTACSGDEGPGHLTAATSRIDFGQVVHGDRANRSLTLTNHADRPVFISRTDPNCACFRILPFLRTLHPGESTDLEIELDSTKVPAERLRGKVLVIESDDTVMPYLRIALEGTIVALYHVEPRRLDAGVVRAGAEIPQRIRIRPTRGYRVEVVEVLALPQGLLDVTVEPTEDGYALALRLHDDVTGRGALSAVVRPHLRVTGDDGTDRRYEEDVRILGQWPEE
jgi:hypothetical protein